ncbi:MAG: hypothetical protein ACKO7R_18855, partial [Pseudanabaena sp.]
MAKNGKNRLAILTIFHFRRTDVELKNKPCQGFEGTKWPSHFVLSKPLQGLAFNSNRSQDGRREAPPILTYLAIAISQG